MEPRVLSLLPAAAALLLVIGVAIVSRRRLLQGGVEFVTQDPDDEPTLADEASATVASIANTVAGSSTADMQPSAQLLDMLKRGEALALRRYRLGDGGWTIGYGRFYRDPAEPPEAIDQATADAWFADDVESRAARWVRAYVKVPLLQQQFDALTSMAYNLSPKSFRSIAEEVNAGNDPADAALQYVRAGTDLERGLRNRRAREITLFREGVYA